MVEWIFLDRCVLMIIFVFSRQYLQKSDGKNRKFHQEIFLMISYCKLKILSKKSEVPNIGNFDRWYFLMISYCKLKVLVREYFLMISFENTRIIKENPFFGVLPNPPQNNGWVDFPWHYMTGSPLLWIFLDEPGGLTLPPLRTAP